MLLPRKPVSAARCNEAGLSLLEVLFAALLVATVAVFLAPFFVRAVGSNLEGGEASQATNFSKSFLETSFAIPLNHSRLLMDGTGDGEPGGPAGGATCGPTTRDNPALYRRVLNAHYSRGPVDASSLDLYAGDERWVPSTDGDSDYDLAKTWDAQVKVRDYNYFEMSQGLISASSSTALFTANFGVPYLLDCPLDSAAGASFRHLKELSVEIEGRRKGGTLGSGQEMETRQVRSY